MKRLLHLPEIKRRVRLGERIEVVNEILEMINELRKMQLETNSKTPQAGWEFACEEISWRIKKRFLIDIGGKNDDTCKH